MVLRRLDALEENLVFEDRVKNLEETDFDFVDRLSKIEAAVGIFEVKERPDKANDSAMQSATQNTKNDACKEPKRAAVDITANALQMEQLKTKVQCLDHNYREMQATLRTLSEKLRQQPVGSSSRKEDQQVTQ